MRALVVALAVGVFGVAPAFASINTSDVKRSKVDEQIAFPFVSVCYGYTEYFNLGGVGGGGGHIAHFVHTGPFLSITGCPV